MELKLEIGSNFILDGQSFGCPSSAGSFSSCSASTNNDPYTPVSSRCSPRQRHCSVDFESSFCDENMLFEMTPPSTTASGYFPTDVKHAASVATAAASNTTTTTTAMELPFVPDGLPTTPGRYSLPSTLTAATTPNNTHHHHHPHNHHHHIAVAGQLGSSSTPPQDPRMDMYSFSEGLDTSMFLMPTPTQSLQGPHHHHHQHPPPPPPPQSMDMSDLWAMHRDMDSPINFFETSQPPVLKSMVASMHGDGNRSGSSSSNSNSSSNNCSPFSFNGSIRRLFMDEAQQKSAILQKQLLSQVPPPPPHHASAAKREKSGRGGGSLPDGIPVRRIAGGSFKCSFQGCSTKPFARKEHLKRHEKTHDPTAQPFLCEFCSQTFSRSDNAFQHLWLHTRQKGKNSRTTYFPEAVKKYEEEKRRRCRQSSSSSSLSSSSAHRHILGSTSSTKTRRRAAASLGLSAKR